MKTAKEKSPSVKQATTGAKKEVNSKTKVAKSNRNEFGLKESSKLMKHHSEKSAETLVRAAKKNAQNVMLGRAIKRLELLGASLASMDVVITDTSVIVKPKVVTKTNYVTTKSVLRGATVTPSYTSIIKEHHKAIATLVKQSSLETETAISTLKRRPSAADKDFFKEVKMRALGLVK